MFDLDAYLQRVGCRGPRQPTLALLRALCAAQPAAIAFENLDPLLGRPPRLALADLQAKLVRQRRGGYCYEQNLLLREALLALGFQVTGLAARVLWQRPPTEPPHARSHMLLRVDLPDGGAFIADAGFGGHLLAAPLGLHGDAGTGGERVVRDGDMFRVEADLPAGWAPLYAFTLEPQLPVDYEPLNWFTATRPGALFAHNLLVERRGPGGRASLFNDRLTLRPAGGPVSTRRITGAGELVQVLDEIFDLQPPVPAAELFARVPQGLDGPFVPG